MRGNIKVVVANITALSNLKLALVGEPDVALAQEPRACMSEVAAESERVGFAVAMARSRASLRCSSDQAVGSSCTPGPR